MLPIYITFNAYEINYKGRYRFRLKHIALDEMRCTKYTKSDAKLIAAAVAICK